MSSDDLPFVNSRRDDMEPMYLPAVDSYVMGATRETSMACDADAPATTHEALKARGNAAYRRKDYFKAIEEYERAFAMNDRDVALLTNISAAHLAVKNYKEAIEAATRAMHIDPSWAKGWYRAALAIDEWGGDDEAAIGALELGMSYVGENEQMRALYTKLKFKHEKDSLSAEEMKQKGNDAMRAGSLAEAVEWYTRGIAKDGTSDNVLAALYNNRAECHRREYEHENVIADCKEVLKIDPDNLKANLRLAVACEHLEKFTDAVCAYERVLMVDKKDTNRVRERITRCRIAESYSY